ncbi:MAG: TetR/AcrR family transcriptional regulator [Anaerolineae bacterium]
MAARRADIMAGATRVFAEKGFQRATIREIAEAADVAEGTIYNHFESKADLLVTIINEMDSLAERRTDLEAGLQRNLHDFFVTFMQERLDRAGPDFGILLSLMPEVLADEELRRSLLEDHMLPEMEAMDAHARERIARGQMRPVDVPLTVRILQSTILGLSILQALGDPVTLAAIDDPQRLVSALATMVVDGLAPDASPCPGLTEDGSAARSLLPDEA